MQAHAKWPLLTGMLIAITIILSSALKSQRSAESQASDHRDVPNRVEPRSPDPNIPNVPLVGSSNRGTLPPGIPIEPSTEEQAAQRQAGIVALDQKLRSEPMDPDWAFEQQAVIRKAIAGTPGDGFNASVPDNMDAVCRSSMCRISMVYKDEEDAAQMHGRLTLGLGGAISTARTFFVPRSDGGVEMVVFAGQADRLR
jgi:hypothetical protein